MHVFVCIPDVSGAAVKRWGECGRMGDWRRRLAAGQLAAGAERGRAGKGIAGGGGGGGGTAEINH